VFWLRILSKIPGGVLVQNVAEKSKRELVMIERTIEKNLLYPLIRWKDVSRYHAHPSVYILLAQDVESRTGIKEATMRRDFPKSYAYLKEFEDLLVRRAAYRRYQGRSAFYSMYDIGTYTLAPIKVVWRRMDRQINAAVVQEANDEFLGVRPVIPQETCVFIEVNSLAEAHYLCGLLNSSIVNFVAKSHSVRGGKGFGTPSMLDFLNIKEFKSDDALHKELSSLSRKAHKLKSAGDDVAETQQAINKVVARIWGIGEKELKAVDSALSNMDA